MLLCGINKDFEMKIDILTLFPDMFGPLSMSMLGRAGEKGILEINTVNIRDFSKDKHKKADDYPFGGGAGMVMMAQPIFDCLKSVGTEGKKLLYMSPRGKVIDQQKISELAKEDGLVILCGHYEGVDQRVLDEFGFEEVSIGDYILTGGELPAMVLIDTVARMIPDVLASEDSAFGESIYSGLLEYPQYTRPASFEGIDVPPVLTSGNHEAVYLWQFEESLKLTKERRPDLLEKYAQENASKLSKKERKILDNYIKIL